MKSLDEFIKIQRGRFEIRHNNMFAKSFSEIERYFYFLQIIEGRHNKLVQEYANVFNQFQKTINKSPGSHEATIEQIKLDSEMTRFGNLIQLEIESFYQFAKILLDKAAMALEFYFGKDKDVEINRHRSLVEHKKGRRLLKIEVYSKNKDLAISDTLLDKMKQIQDEISSFRDDYITHLQSPRVVRGMSVDGKMLITKIYPKSEEESKLVVSKSFDELIVSVKRYVDLLVMFIKENQNKTTLELLKKE